MIISPSSYDHSTIIFLVIILQSGLTPLLKIKQEPTTEEHLNETYAMVEVTRSGKPILQWSGGMHTAIKSFVS